MILNFIKTNYKVLLAILLIIVSFATGRYTVPVRVETKTITVEVEHKKEDTKVDKVTTIVVKPDGTKTTVITDKTETKTTDDTNSKTETSKLVKNNSGNTNISVLAGLDALNPKFVYGLSATRTIIGPVSIGVWGLNNLTFGASVGLQF